MTLAAKNVKTELKFCDFSEKFKYRTIAKMFYVYFLQFCVRRGATGCKHLTLSIEYLVAKFGVDTTKTEFSKY